MTLLPTRKVRLTATSLLAISAVLSADMAMAQLIEDEIVVTARRTTETLIEAPVAVTAVTEAQIENLGIQSIDDIARHTAGFSFSNAFGRTTERPVIRGAANILAGVQFGVEAGAAYFVDGVYYSGSLQALDIRNLDRVEVVKGPQSALYGRNTYSGAINFITKRPSQDGFEGSLELIAAEDGEYQFYGRMSNSLENGALGYSLSGRYYNYDGDSAWTNAADNGSQMGGEESLNLNATIDVNFSESTTAIFRLGYTEDDDGPRPFRLIGAEQNNCFPGYRSGAFYNPNPFPFPTPFGGLYPETVTTDNNFQYFCGNLSQFEDLDPAQDLDGTPFVGVEREMLFGTALIEHDFSNNWGLSLSAGIRTEELITGSDSDHQVGSVFGIGISPFFSIPTADAFLNTTGQNDIEDVSLEARLSSDPTQRVRGSIGAYYYDFKNEGQTGSLGRVSAADPLGLQRSNDQTIENVAVFGTLDFDVNDQLTLSGEVRYQDEEKGRVEFGDGAGARVPTYDESVSFDDIVYKLIASYDVNPDTSAYASYASGVKPGGVNGPDGLVDNAEFYAPENVDAFEVGLKSRLSDRARFTLSAYFNDISQYQLTTPVAASAGSNVNSVATNQGNAEILGFEFEGSFDVNDYMRIGGSYSYTDAEFTSGCDDFQFTLNTGGYLISAFDRTNPPTTGGIRGSADPTTPIFDPNNLFTGNLSCDITGNKVPLTSEHQASLYAQAEFPLTDTMNGFVNADFTHESSKFVQVHNLMETGDTNIFSGQIGVTFSDAVRFEIFGRNLFDERTPPAATRWFDLLEGFNTISSQIPGATSVDRNLTGPRSTFLSYRRGRQIGARLQVDF
jgi:outer membrane receptor protein involved in Fe transport